MIKYFIMVLFLNSFSIMAAELNLSRVSNFPIWSKLTPFEIRSLNSVAAAKRGDDGALLRLFLLASGDVRTESDFLKIQSFIRKYFELYGDEISSEKDLWRKGYLLNRTMHKYFFYNKQQDSSLNYQENQSQLSEIFRTRKFNCISSTLLYLYLARKVNLQVKAVVLPTHSFVELKLENGKKVDVETTSANGFDWVHDRKFYKQVAANWFSERDLEASTFEDYQNREIIAPWLLTPLNMRNQHTNPKRMNLNDRIRLQEMAASINNRNDETLLSLLYVYNEFFINSNELLDKNVLKTFYDVSYSGVADKIAGYVTLDKELNEVSHWYFSQAAYSYMVAGEAKTAKTIFLRHYPGIKKIANENPRIFSNYGMVFNGLLKQFLKTKSYRLADDFIEQVNQIGIESSRWQQSVIWYYSLKAKPFWDKKDWPKIIQIWTDMKAKGLIWTDMEKFLKNIESAYQNYSLEYQQQGNWRAAAEVLLRCTEEISLADGCMERLNKLQKQHNLFQ